MSQRKCGLAGGKYRESAGKSPFEVQPKWTGPRHVGAGPRAAGKSRAKALVWDRARRAQWQIPPGPLRKPPDLPGTRDGRQPAGARLSQRAGGVRGVGGPPVVGEPAFHPGSAPGSTGGHGLSSGAFVVNYALAPAGHCPPFPGGEAPELRSPAQARKGLEPRWAGPGGVVGSWELEWGRGVALADRPVWSPSSVKSGGAVSCQAPPAPHCTGRVGSSRGLSRGLGPAAGRPPFAEEAEAWGVG